MKKSIVFLALITLFSAVGQAQNTVCNAQFTTAVTGNTVRFNPAVLGDSATTRHLWYFGDGTMSDARSPLHTYPNCGVFTVKHVFKAFMPNGAPLCADSVTTTINLPCPQPCTLQAAFTSAIRSITPQSVMVNFSNTTVNIQPGDSVWWTFGDNSPAVYSLNAQHAYTANGTYTVCLRVKKPTVAGAAPCVSEFCRPVTITGISGCNYQASYTASVSPTNALRRIFTNTSPLPSNNNYTATWTFGDGTGASSWNAEHTYATPGRYRVCLRIVYGNNCVAEKCDSISVFAASTVIPCDSIRVSFTSRPEASRPNRIYFQAVTNAPIIQQTWTITPISGQNVPTVTLNQFNPIYEFTQGGGYRVCLRAVIRPGCIKEYCNTIQVVMPATNACLLTAFPNPAQNQVSVIVLLSQARTITARLFNNQNVQVGSISQQGTIGANQVTFNVSALPRGIYTIRVEMGGQICTARFEKI
ncbi:MAG: PKD domain-containing protein [Bacteroidetes bacterium]|nr:PKD domain-containing protein [Bacteroidota bacterium]